MSHVRLAQAGPTSSPPLCTPDGALVHVDAAGTLTCREPTTGEARWTVALGSAVAGPLARADDGVVYAGDADGRLHAVGPDGDRLWMWDAGVERAVPLPGPSRAFAAGVSLDDDGHLYAGSDDWHLYSLTPDGRLRWATPVTLPVRAPCATAPGGAVLVPGLDGHLTALSRETGEARWRRDLVHPMVAAPVIAADGTALLGTLGGRVLCIDPATGDVLWRRDLDAGVQGPVAPLVDGLLVGTLDGHLVCLDTSGQIRWTHDLGAAVRGGPRLLQGGDRAVAATEDGRVQAVDTEGTPVWTVALPVGDAPVAIQASPAVAGARVVVATADGALWSVGPDAQPEPAPSPRSATASGELPTTVALTGLQLAAPPVVHTLHPAGLGWAPVQISLVEVTDDGQRAVAWLEQPLGTGSADTAGLLRSALMARRGDDGAWTLSGTARVQLGARSPLPPVSMTVTLVLRAATDAWSDGAVELRWEPRLDAPPLARALQRPRALIERAGKPFLASRDALRALARGLPQASELRGWGALAGAAARALPLGARLLDPATASTWGLLDAHRRFSGRGAVRVAAVERETPGVRAALSIDRERQRIRARLRHDPGDRTEPGLLLVDDDAVAPLPLDPTRRTTVRRDDDGVPTEVLLELPLELDIPPRTRVLVVAGGRVIGRASFGAR